jgi:membrane-bound lytic murein transglycosylase B
MPRSAEVSPGGFETWKQEFAAEARGKGIGANAAAALMQTNYASATIAADRSQRSFNLSLDQFLAKRGATTIVARGRSLKQSQGALFASIQQRYGVPPGRCSRSGAWRPALAASAAIRTCCRRSRRWPMTAAARNSSPSSFTRR